MERHYWTCHAVPETSASLRVNVPIQLLLSPILLFCRTSTPGNHQVGLSSYFGEGPGQELLLEGGCPWSLPTPPALISWMGFRGRNERLSDWLLPCGHEIDLFFPQGLSLCMRVLLAWFKE